MCALRLRDGVGAPRVQWDLITHRPFTDETDVQTAMDAAKTMAHVLRNVYSTQLEETEPPLEFEGELSVL